jgi:amidohydrolase
MSLAQAAILGGLVFFGAAEVNRAAVRVGAEEAVKASSFGFEPADSTWALQAAIDSGAAGEDDVARRVEQLSRQVAPTIVQWRRDFHAHPELSNREARTAAKVVEQLKAMGIEEIRTRVAGHGVVALVRGRSAGPTVALRADMDALPIAEQTGLPFASQNPGVMHACGHDAHTAMLLGAARILVEVRGQLRGTVKLIFQPAEESPPVGQPGGARQMVKEGVLKDPEVAAIFALHVNPELETGKLGCRAGPILAGADHFRITVKGKQSHGAMPWQGIDPIVTAADVILALQTISSRGIDARKPVVVSIGMIHAGTAWNIIPGEVVMEGTIRTHEESVRRQAIEQLHRIAEHTALAHGATAEVGNTSYGPATRNDPELVRRMKPTLERVAGAARVVEVEPFMGSEDFAEYAQKKPGCFVFLGVRNEAIGAVHNLHTPHTIVDEAALPLGARLLATLAVDFLNDESQRAARPPR